MANFAQTEDESSDAPDETKSVADRLRTEEPQAPFGQDEPNPNVVQDDTR